MKQILFFLSFVHFLATPSMGQNYGSDKKTGDKIYVSGNAKNLTAQNATGAKSIAKIKTTTLKSSNNNVPVERMGTKSSNTISNVNKIRDFAERTITYFGRVKEIRNGGEKNIVTFSTGNSILIVEIEKKLDINMLPGGYYSIKGLVKLKEDVPTIYVNAKQQISMQNASGRFEAIITD